MMELNIKTRDENRTLYTVHGYSEDDGFDCRFIWAESPDEAKETAIVVYGFLEVWEVYPFEDNFPDYDDDDEDEED